MMKRFIFTEKSVRALELYNKYVLDVDRSLTKLQIKLIVEKTFFVRVQRVNSFFLQRTSRKSIYSTNRFKRVLVTLASQEKIRLY
jgi:ribosomal protein L23